jgi:hypothetical protein
VIDIKMKNNQFSINEIIVAIIMIDFFLNN